MMCSVMWRLLCRSMTHGYLIQYFLLLLYLLQCANGSGFFELQVLEMANPRGELSTGECCGGFTRSTLTPRCMSVCNTFFRLCLKEYQSNITSTGSCSFGNASSAVLGRDSFTLADPERGKLVLPFTFRWTINNKIVKRIPRGARSSVATKLSAVIQNTISQNSTESWQNLFLFAYNVLHIPSSGKKGKLKSLTAAIKQNTTSVNPVTIEKKKQKNTSLVRFIECKVSDGDLKGAIKILSSEDQLADNNDATFKNLKNKHPTPPNIAIPPVSEEERTLYLTVKKEQVQQAIFSFPNGSAAGLDGLRPQHLKDLITQNNGIAGQTLLKHLTTLCNFMFEGNVNENFIPYIYGASLTALTKKDGGIRPIAVGSTLRRLASKLGCRACSNDLVAEFEPHQMGFGIKGGCEGTVHAARSFIEKGSGEIFVKVDVKNAFNSVNRANMLDQTKRIIPKLYPYLHQCYSEPSNLFYNNKIIKSSHGCQQGDPCAPAIFSLTINPVVRSLSSCFNVWFLDDGSLGGNGEDVIQDLYKIKTDFQKIGLQLNTEKCEIFFFPSISPERKEELYSQLTTVLDGFKCLSSHDFKLLGSPLTEDNIPQIFNEKESQLTLFLQRLESLNPHVAFYLLRHCLWIPKFIYLLRSSPIYKYINHLRTLDFKIKLFLENLFNITFTEESWSQCCLPVKYGEIGIRKIEDISLISYITSTYCTKTLMELILSQSVTDSEILYLDDAVSKWKLVSNIEIPESPKIQANWDVPIIKLTLDKLLNSSENAKPRILAVCQPESGAWLHAYPSPQLGTLLDKQSLRISISLRIGADVCHPHICVCGEKVDASGVHGLSCKMSAGRFSRHAAINDILRRSLASSGFPSTLEPNGLFREDGKRPDGMTLIPWNKGRALVWDATCVDTLAPSHLHLSSNEAGSAADHAAVLKINKYKTIIENYDFVPLAVETLGSFGSDATKLVKKIGRLLNITSGDPRASSYLKQRISLAIQRGNVASILGTLPSTFSMEEIFYLK